MNDTRGYQFFCLLMQIRWISPELFHFTSLSSSQIDMAKALIVKRGIVPVRIRYISLSSALCQVNAVRSERFRSDGVILDERMNLVNFYNAKRYLYTGVPFAPVCAPSVARPAASSSHPIYQCGIGEAKLQQEVQRILHNIKRIKR